jgi:uncharacterized protein
MPAGCAAYGGAVTDDPAPVPRARRAALAVEHVAVFYGLVGLYTLAGSPGSPIPPLLLGAGATWWWLRRQPDFDRTSLRRVAGLRAQLPGMLVLALAAAAAGVALIAVFAPTHLFDVPRRQPLIWGIIVVFYPLLSVYPQELIFRAFLLHRYRPVVGADPAGRRAAALSAAAFGFVHIIFGHPLSVLLTVAGGWRFARRYQRTRSLPAAAVEHALFGVLAFTIGLGELFYHGTLRS